MKIVPLGLQCSVLEGIKQANMRECAYPFDWCFSPCKTTYDILKILIDDGVEKSFEYMTTGYTYYQLINGTERHLSVDFVTNCQMNKKTGLGIVHYTVDDNYKIKLKRRLERLLKDIKSNENILFIYADAANPRRNYYLDEIEYGTDATEYLLKIHDLIYPFNNNIKILYFCWNERKKVNEKIEYISYEYQNDWHDVKDVIRNYLVEKYQK